MAKSKVKVITKKRVVKDKASDKVGRVMQEFKDGQLKSSSGEIVTDQKQALAIAISEAGLTKDVLKSFAVTDIANKIKVMKAFLIRQIAKEQAAADQLDAQITGLLMRNPQPDDKKIHALAESNGMQPSQVEERLYAMFSEFLQGGADTSDVDQEQMKQGISIEHEHTENPQIAAKIAHDHLKEIPNYYTWLKWMEDQAKKYKSPEEFMAYGIGKQ